jgi:hypothetical protein
MGRLNRSSATLRRMADLFPGGAIDPATHERISDDSTSHISV